MVARRFRDVPGVSRLSYVLHTLVRAQFCTGFGYVWPAKCQMSHAGSVWGPLLDLVMPRQCAACALPGFVLCAGCRMAVQVQPVVAVSATVCAVSDPLGLGRAVVRGYKVGGHRSLAPLIADSLARAVRQSLESRRWEPRVAIVAVPQRRRAQTTRGFDSTAVIARKAARLLTQDGIACVVVQGVGYVRQPDDQRGLGVSERHLNVVGSMRLRGKASRRICGEEFGMVVAVDDVVTTGATLAELTRSLVAGGASCVGAAAAFSTPRRCHLSSKSPG